jgi:hypothetical protein
VAEEQPQWWWQRERMRRGAFGEATWRKSSRSGSGSGNNCVEVAFAGPAVAVRDSKDTRSPEVILSLRGKRIASDALF